MSAKYTKLLSIPGLDARIVVDADYKWGELGKLLSESYDSEQAKFLEAMGKTLMSLGGNGLMQIQFLADHIGVMADAGAMDAGAIKWFLNELLIRLED